MNQLDKIKNKNNSLFENNSIGDNPLFGIIDFLKDDYLNNNYYVKNKTLEECREELSKVLNKFKTLKQIYNNKLENVKEQIKKLDDDYINMNKISFLGNSFFDMNSLEKHFNHVVDYDVIYKRNLVYTNDYIVKSNEELSPVEFYIEEQKGNIFVNFINPSNIQDIFIEFFNDFTFSIFGINEDDSMTNLFENVSSSQKLFINTNSTEFKGLFITAIGDISGYIKDLKIFNYSKKSILKNGIITYKPKQINKLSKLFFASNSQTKLFYLTEKESEDLLINFEKTNVFNKYLNNSNLIEKNKEINNSFSDKTVFVELFERDINMSEKLKIFGKESGD